MPAAYPTWAGESPSPVSGLVSASAMFPWIVISRPSRIQVTPRARITSVCHRLHGSRSILAGTRVSTVFASLNIHLLLLPLSRGLSPRTADGMPPPEHPPEETSTYFATPSVPEHAASIYRRRKPAILRGQRSRSRSSDRREHDL